MPINFKILKTLILFFLSLSINLSIYASHISGNIKDVNGHAIPFASVYIKNSTYSVNANVFGEYFMELNNGKHTLIFSSIGYEKKEKSVIIENNSVIVNIVLDEESKKLIELEIVSNTKNKALEIIKRAKETKKNLKKRNYKCVQYSKNSIEKRQFKLKRKDTIKLWDLDTSKNINFENDILKFIESYGIFYQLSNGKKYWDFKAYHDFAQTNEKDDFVIIQSFEEFGEYNITPQYNIKDKYEQLISFVELELDLYSNNIDLTITDKPVVSPLSPSSRGFYKYDYLGTIIEEDSNKVHKIKVTPRFNNEPLLKGTLFIEDSNYRVNSFEFELNGPKKSEFEIQNFLFIQNYKLVKNVNVLNRKIIDFSIKEDIYKIIGNAITLNKEFELDVEVPEKFKKNQIKIFRDSSENISKENWVEYRTIDLKNNELKYIDFTDSLREYYKSEKYLVEKDSSYNKIKLSEILWEGVGRKNRYKGYRYVIWPLLSQFNFFGVGGYRHTLGFNYHQNIRNKYKITTQNTIDYGIVNEDFKGTTKVSIITNDRRYKQVSVGVGDQYKLINRFPSLSTAFSRSNFIRSRHFEGAYRTEIINGVYAEFKFLYCRQDPITNLNLNDDLVSEFDSLYALEIETPDFDLIEFKPYNKIENRIQITWLPFQKFYYKKNRKIVLGSDFPTINLIYRKGLPNKIGLKSEVNFDYIEIGANDEFNIPNFGQSRWNFKTGSFLNDNNLRIIEWKYFRGSDPFFFSNPLSSFQLLGLTISTKKSFFSANYLHNFNGNILNKIPLISKLKLQLSAGTAGLLIPNQSLRHFEAFIGISRAFRIFGGLVKFGYYISSSFNTTEGLKVESKVGASGYDSFTNKWDY